MIKKQQSKKGRKKGKSEQSTIFLPWELLVGTGKRGKRLELLLCLNHVETQKANTLTC